MPVIWNRFASPPLQTTMRSSTANCVTSATTMSAPADTWRAVSAVVAPVMAPVTKSVSGALCPGRGSSG